MHIKKSSIGNSQTVNLANISIVGFRLTYITAFLGFVVSALLAVAAVTAPLVMYFFVCVLGLLVTLGWPYLLNLPSPKTTHLILTLTIFSSLVGAIGSYRVGLAIVAAMSVGAVFVVGIWQAEQETMQIFQFAGTYLGILLIISSTLWLQLARHSASGRMLVVLVAIISACVAALNAFITRTTFFVAVLNGIVVGISVAMILHLNIMLAIILAFLIAGFYEINRRIFLRIDNPNYIPAAFTYAVIPLSLLSVVSLALLLFVV